MKNGRNVAATAAAAVMLAAPLIIGSSAARADELSDLRANQELLQQRLDQLAQARVPGNLFGVGGGKGPTTVQMMGGSFPRSFLIPGTDTSIRVGGEIRMNVLYWFNGGNPNQGNPSTNGGTTGQLNSIGLTGTTTSARGHAVFQQSPQQSKLNFETRTPTAYGEARTFVEFDFAGGIANSSRPLSGSDSLIPRLRHAYGTLGGILAGQANSNFADSDAGMESIDFGGLIGHAGPSRVPQLRYTMPLAGWGLAGALSVSAEAPETEIWAPTAGVFGAHTTNDINATSASNKTCVLSPSGTAACSLTTALPNPLKNSAPDLVAAWYIPQPWGHVDFGAVVRPTMQIKAGNVDRDYVGYGFNFSGDVKPHWFGWNKDYFVWDFVYGNGAGRYLYAGSGSSFGLVSNYSAKLAAVPGAPGIRIRTTSGFAGELAYRHQWTSTLRSNIGLGIWHLDIPGLNGAVCPASASRTSGGCALNEELVNGIVNLFYSPVPFVDFGVEYMWGHRFTVSGARGDENVLESRVRVRF
jgi:Porin subfamily